MRVNHRLILQLLLRECSWAEIAQVAGCSRRDISRVKKAIDAHGVRDADAVCDGMLTAWFPDGRRAVVDEYEFPDFDGVLAAQKSSRHFTLQMAWQRYVDGPGGKRKYGYSQFCALYSNFLNRNDLTAVLHHEPGRAVFVDWAGDSMPLVDAVTGETAKAYLFVGTLPYSGMVFCRAYLNMQTAAWLDAHQRMFTAFGGVTALIVPDNALTATHRPVKGDPARAVTGRYQDFADHYGVAIVPAGVKRPKHKAAVEAAVNVVNKRVIGYLEDAEWNMLDDLNAAIDERVWEINHVMGRKDGTTRFERFEAEERELLAALPDTRFEEVDWKVLKVQRNYHVTADYQHYSVPYKLAGRQVRVRLTSGRVSVFDGEVIVAEHTRKTGRKGQYSTLGEHVPPQHEHLDELYSRDWFVRRATAFGPATVDVIEQILDRHQIEAQGYLDCQNILGTLGKKNTTRLEAACQELLNRGAYPTYTTLKRIMGGITSDSQAPARPRPAPSTRKPPSDGNVSDVFVRDPSHYALPAIDAEGY